MTDAIALARALLDCASVTPARGRVFDVLEAALTPIGFAVARSVDGDAPDGPVENLLATRAGTGPHIGFAGHLDVVPAGEGWTGDPFASVVRGDLLYGRGAIDMKGAIAAFVAACASVPDARVTFIITGDEEGPATYGTRALIDRMRAHAIIPDWCLVGEPTSAQRLGDTIKIGRRGSVNIMLTATGMQGHVAYPDLADNPIPRLVSMLHEVDAIVLDAGTDWFQPSNVEVTTIDVGNPAANVIPAEARARLSIRFNDRHTGSELAARIAALAQRHGVTAEARISGEAFLTEPGALSTMVSRAIARVTGVTPALSTSGGTSDARFLVQLCPVIEFGLVNATMHKVDEAVALADLETLTAIYAAILKDARGAG